MDQKIILRFRNSSKAGTTVEFPVAKFPNVTIGRDPRCEVAFDPDKDVLVGRAHARISVDGDNFWIGDLGSRNGTYVNTQRVSGRVKLMAGDIVQLGPGGPEFEFAMDPPPAGPGRATRLATDITPAQKPIGMTGEATPGVTLAVTPAVTPVVTPQSGEAPERPPIGKPTVERMTHEGQRHSRNHLLLAIAAIAFLMLDTDSVFWARVSDVLRPKSLSATDISTLNLDSVVEVEFGWKLIDTGSGRQLNQLYFPNVKVVRQTIQTPCCTRVREVREPIIAGGPAYLAMFVSTSYGVEPLLTTGTGRGHNKAIGETGMDGSGFVVSSDGFILTNRNVAASWNAAYRFPDSKAVLLTSEGGHWVVKPMESPGGWVPSDAKVLTHVDSPDPAKLEAIDQYPAGKRLEGRNDYLDVTFARNRIRVPAKLARVSDHVDVAMIKVDMPRALRKCDLNDNYDAIKTGDVITVMGYPDLSPAVDGAVRSQYPFKKSVAVREDPDPTVNTGNIARVIRGKNPIRSGYGDVYQLTVAATGAGNILEELQSGGPVFDDQGRVVGLFTSSRNDGRGTKHMFAVPIRYGMELIGLTKVM